MNLWRSEEVVLSAKSWRGVQLTQLHELSWAAQRPRAGVTGWGHVQGSRAGGMRVARGDLHLRMGGVIVQTLRVKRKCQLVVRLKANECYQELLRYLSSYINLLNIRLCLGLWPLRKCYWRYNRYHPRVCLDHIAGHIALIALLWPYRWSYCFDCIALIALIALTVSLVVSLWFSCSEVFSAFGIILTICSSNCERPKTEFTALMNHALTSDHPAKPICVYWIAGSSRVTSRPSSIASLPASLKLRGSVIDVTANIPLPKGDHPLQ